jgi:hypothetical protein
MRPSLWFVVPAHGREDLTAICLRQLRRTCDALHVDGIDAEAVVIADDDNLTTARALGFGTIRRDNQFLSRKFNDGIQLALDPDFNPRPADYVVPCGSDDWVDHRILLELPEPTQVLCFENAAFVSEDGTNIAALTVRYISGGGVGIRVYPRRIMTLMGYRPADEDRKRACDTSIWINVNNAHDAIKRTRPEVIYGDRHQWQIVDWKSPGQQLNSFDDVVARFRGGRGLDPYKTLAGTFPADALDDMRRLYQSRQPVAA